MNKNDLTGKTVINSNGNLLGIITAEDLVIDRDSNSVESIILHNRQELIVIPVNAIKQLGSRVIVVELKNKIKLSS